MNDTNLNQSDAVRYDSDDATTAHDDRHTVHTYVNDMLALERHIAQPLNKQVQSDDTADFGAALSIVNRIKSTTDAHIETLEAHVNSGNGSGGAATAKSAISQLLGAGAAAINGVRKTKVSKSLRDDYTALSLASVSYTMLHATALGLGDTATAEIAKRHLADYAPIIIDISKAIPGVVLEELRLDGQNVQAGAAHIAEANTQSAWK